MDAMHVREDQHELAGAEYGDAWDELPEHPEHVPFHEKICGMEKTVPCNICGKKFKLDDFMRQHRAAAHSKEEIAKD